MSADHDKMSEDSVTILEQLREARAEVEQHLAAVNKEMKDKLARREGIPLAQCYAWPSYQAAMRVLNALRDRYEV